MYCCHGVCQEMVTFFFFTCFYTPSVNILCKIEISERFLKFVYKAITVLSFICVSYCFNLTNIFLSVYTVYISVIVVQ